MDDILWILFICSGLFLFLLGVASFLAYVYIPYLLKETPKKRRWNEEWRVDDKTESQFDEEYYALYENLLSSVASTTNRSDHEH